MATKRRKFDKTKRVKAIARARVGNPPPARVLDDKPARSKPKHKIDWLESTAD
ncbi:MAG TPA: hypothetical protein VGL97_08610 [Bryobacteraceae bacterium]|jgi:hypothetical protein